MPESLSSDRTFRISLVWLLFGIGMMVGIGILGGLIGQTLMRPILPLTSDQNRLITTVQEVTISPGKAAAAIVKDARRSVIGIGQAESAGTLLATGFILTSDGIVATVGDLPATGLVAFDSDHKIVPLEKAGSDSLFGISYYRIRDRVFVPLELRTEDSQVGEILLGLSQAPATGSDRIIPWYVGSQLLPSGIVPAGIQRLLQGDIPNDAGWQGAPMLDEEGKIGGLMFDSRQGTVLPATALRQSMNRFFEQQHESHIWSDTGLTIEYVFTASTRPAERVFGARILGVRSASQAALGGLRAGDVIIAIRNEPLAWEKSVVTLLSEKRPLPLTVIRNAAELHLTLNDVPVT